MTTFELINARDFDSTETVEINQYIVANVPYTVLQKVFPLTENSISKAQVYTIMHRILSSARNYVKDEGTKEKLNRLIHESDEIYPIIFELLIRFNSTLNFGKNRIQKKIEEFFIVQKNNEIVNKLIDIFLVFAEKQTLFDADKVAGLDMDTEEGKELYKKLNSSDDTMKPVGE